MIFSVRSSLQIASVLALTACTPRQWPETAPGPQNPPASPAATNTAADPVVRSAPPNWHLLDFETDGVPGIGVLRAERELLRGRQPLRTIVVAVIDNGLDTAHSAIKPRLWVNDDEVPGNGRDDDRNGFVDDVHGWNFIGGKDGSFVKEDTYELTRIAAQCERPAGRDSLPADLRGRCPELQQEFARERQEIDQTLNNISQIEALYETIKPILVRASGTESLTVARVSAITPSNDTVRQARGVYLQLHSQGITEAEVESAKKAYESRANFGFNKSYDPRKIVGDNYPDTSVKRYGNSNVVGPGGEHGTHVAGIIGGVRNGTEHGVGIAQAVRLMALRAVPEGDERDKDIANAIRYAVDNGAHIINMSFGKGYSPYKKLVDDAVRYAESRGVLLVHASGNDGSDVTKSPSYPTPVFVDGGRARTWIEVGASTWRGGDTLVANFSNYAGAIVDVFAPGEDINSTVPGDKYEENSGTSMASPVVAGLAAMLMSYFPSLTAVEVKDIILKSATLHAEKMVVRPGEAGAPLRFGDLSATGGIVNAYAAVKRALEVQP